MSKRVFQFLGRSLKSFLPDGSEMLVCAIIYYVLLHTMDFVSTELCMAFVPGVMESNHLMRDPVTLKFVLSQGAVVKTIYTTIFVALPSLLVFLGTRSYQLASLFWWYYGWKVSQIVFDNSMMLYEGFLNG